MPDDYKTKRQTSDYLKKNIKKITKDIVICLSHFIINKLPMCYSVEKKHHNTMVHTIFKQRDSK